jgi:PAS domain S-box-containing protein
MRPIAKYFLRIVICIAAVLAITAVPYVVSFRDRPFTVALFFLFLVLIVSAVWGLRYAIFVSFLAALGFAWLSPPVGRFEIDDPRDIFALVAFLFTGILTSYLSDRARREALNANQRRAEAVAAQQRFADLVNSVEGIVWEADAETFAFSFVSAHAERILGYPPEYWLREPTFWKDHLHPDDRDWAVQFWLHTTAQKQNHDFEYRMIAADGRVAWMRDLVTVVVENERAKRLRGVMVDVTERKRAEEELRRTEAYLAEAQRLTHTGSWANTPLMDKVFYWSEEMFRIFGFDPKKGLPTSDAFLERIYPDDREKVYESLQNALQRQAHSVSEFRIILPDGTVRHAEAIGHPVFNVGGDIVEYIGTTADVTERKHAEDALRRSEAYLAEAQRLTHTGSWVYKAAGAGHHWSEENFRIWGFDPKQGTPDLETVAQRIHPTDRDRVGARWETMVRARTDFEDEYRIVLPDGAVRHIHVVGHPVFSASGELIELVGTHVDVTERKRAEEERERLQLLQADLAHINRVNMMGELTASLAHEIRQPITAVITSADACLRWLRNPPDLERARLAVARIKEDGTRAADVISHLRSFYKKGASPEREMVDVNQVIREIIVLLHNEASRNSVSVRPELGEEIPKVMADRVQLQQVLMNLMLNAIEAMKETGGGLTIRSQLKQDGQLLISVGDSGVGLPAGSADRIFDAFYTTKPLGSGMGLAITRSIVESHGGRLWATANDGPGTTFNFTLRAESGAHA